MSSSVKTIIELAAKFNIPGATEKIAPLLSLTHGRHEAKEYLIEKGAAAEEPTIKQLKSDDGWTRRFAIMVLREIGTSESISELEKVASDDPDRGIQRSAQLAIEEINARQQ